LVSSATTYDAKEPSFNVAYVDPDTMLPVEYETWSFDLDHANKYDEPKWYKNFELKEFFGLENLSPSSLMKLS
jgi:hypothetical protein